MSKLSPNSDKSNIKHNNTWAGFSVTPTDKIWEKEFLPRLQRDQNIRELYQSAINGWIEACRVPNPDFWPSIELPYDIDRHPAPWELGFFIDDWVIRPDPLNPPEPNQVSHWYPFESCSHLSGFSLELCKAWRPDGDWLVVSAGSHSVVIDIKNRLIFDPRFHADRNAKYILDYLFIGGFVDDAESNKASNVISWLNYHLRPYSRSKLPRVIENALQYDLPDFLQIMSVFSEVKIPNVIKPNPPISAYKRVIRSEACPAIDNSKGGLGNE